MFTTIVGIRRQFHRDKQAFSDVTHLHLIRGSNLDSQRVLRGEHDVGDTHQSVWSRGENLHRLACALQLKADTER